MDLLVTTGRVVVSLAAVLALVWVLAQVARRRGVGGVAASARFAVVARHALGRSAGVAVVRVGDQALVLGVTEHSVRLLARTPLGDVLDLGMSVGPPAEGSREPLLTTADGAAAVGPGGGGLRLLTGAGASPLAGSALSPATWSGALEVLRQRTAR